MIYFILSVLCSTLLGLIFKGFERYGIDNFQAIVFNYFVCVACATLSLGHSPITPQFWEAAWFPYAIVLGAIFISAFTVVAVTVQKFGVTVGAVMQKMSIIISVSFALVYYQESTSVLKLLGIFLAMCAIVLTNWPDQKEESEPKPMYLWLYPAYVLLSSGILEIILQYVETQLVTGDGNKQFVGFVFGTAGVLGLVVLIGRLSFGKSKLELKNLIAGIVLGIPNFGSIYCLMKALGLGWEGSVVFPINNVAIIVCSAILAVLVYQERLNKWNVLGVVIAGLSIVLIGFS